MKAIQLARTQTPTPRLLALQAATANTDGGGGGGGREADFCAVRVVVQIRATLLHYIRDGVVMCVVKSNEEICGVAQCDASQLVVATRSGTLWLVQLPTLPRGVKPLVLKEGVGGTPTSDGAFVRRIGDVPGAQQLCYLASLDALVCTSLLVPTTVIQGLVQGTTRREFEVEDLEGERSTSLCAFSAVDRADHARLVTWLLGSTPPSQTATVVVQGDADGTVRCAVVEAASGRLTGQVKELVRLPEAVHAITPVRLEEGVGADALLVIGSCGSVVLLSRGPTYPHTLFGRVGVPVTTVAFLEGDNPAVAFSTQTMKTCIVSMAQLTTHLHMDVKKRIESKALDSSATEFSDFQDVLSVSAHTGSIAALSLLTRSGRLVSLTEGSVTKYLESSPTSKTAATPTDLRVKTLLQDISQLSQKSSKLQQISERADALLHGLNTTLQFVRLVDTHGVGSIVACSLRLKLVHAGWAMQSRGVQLLFTLRFNEPFQPSQFISSAMWRCQFTVQTASSDRDASYGFPLTDCVASERCVELDASILQQQHGVIKVSCELVFAPGVLDMRELEAAQERNDHPQEASKLASFGIPVVRAKELHLVQLCEPTSDFPMNPVAVREQFTQAQMSGVDGSGQHGHQWWTTLFEDAAVAGIVLPARDIDNPNKHAPPPLRVVTRISCDRTTAEVGAAMKEEDVMLLLYRFFTIESDIEREQWRQACRHVNGKWWIGIRTFTGNLIVLRFTVATAVAGSDADNSSQQHCVEVIAYASNVADLAAVRAVILNTSTVNEPAPHVKGDVERASVALMKTRTELDSLAAMIADICQKTNSAGISERHGNPMETVDICQDELLQLLQRTSQVETRALELYWTSREVTSQHLTL